MMTDTVYLDYNATTPARPQVMDAVMAALRQSGNPSSVHAKGRAARALVENARSEVARLVNARAADVFFTSGATEAITLALSPFVQPAKDSLPFTHLFLSATEHAAVLRGHRFAADAVRILPVDSDGVIDLAVLEQAIADAGADARIMVAVQLANNETGVIQPVAAVAQRVHAANGILVVDAAQAVGKIPVDVKALGADFLVLSGHKFGGPSGVGALVRGSIGLHMADPVLKGGGQERGWRAGTENVPAIAGLGVACSLSREHMDKESLFLEGLRQRLEQALKAGDSGIVIHGEAAPRLPTTVAFSAAGMTAETALMMLDLEGIAVSSGSACSSGKVKASHVLQAMGVAPEAQNAMVRLSLGWSSTTDDVERFLEVWDRIRPKRATTAA